MRVSRKKFPNFFVVTEILFARDGWVVEEDYGGAIRVERFFEPDKFAFGNKAEDIVMGTLGGAVPFFVKVRIHNDESPRPFVEIPVVI